MQATQQIARVMREAPIYSIHHLQHKLGGCGSCKVLEGGWGTKDASTGADSPAEIANELLSLEETIGHQVEDPCELTSYDCCTKYTLILHDFAKCPHFPGD